MKQGVMSLRASRALNPQVRVTLTRPLPLKGERGPRREGVRVTGGEGTCLAFSGFLHAGVRGAGSTDRHGRSGRRDKPMRRRRSKADHAEALTHASRLVRQTFAAACNRRLSPRARFEAVQEWATALDRWLALQGRPTQITEVRVRLEGQDRPSGR